MRILDIGCRSLPGDHPLRLNERGFDGDYLDALRNTHYDGGVTAQSLRFLKIDFLRAWKSWRSRKGSANPDKLPLLSYEFMYYPVIPVHRDVGPGQYRDPEEEPPSRTPLMKTTWLARADKLGISENVARQLAAGIKGLPVGSRWRKLDEVSRKYLEEFDTRGVRVAARVPFRGLLVLEPGHPGRRPFRSI